MVSGSPPAIDHELHNILEELAAAMFPLAAWIDDKVNSGRYKPHGPTPWRDKKRSLTLRDIGALAFFEELLERSAAGAPLAERFAQAIAEPLRFSPFKADAPNWRKSKQLDPTPKFGIVASQNVLADAAGTPVPRAQFYAPFWSLLRQAVGGANPKTPANWEGLAHDFMNDASPHWPTVQPLKSSAFMKQFGRDMLQGLLNMRNPAADPWRVAFLEELGEHRRVGNSFTTDDVETFVRAFKRRISAP